MTKAKQPRRPTSLDVARLAGVSHTTVSFVINDVTTAGISEETRTRVLDAIAQLDYHPHEAARNLRNRSSRIIGVAIPEIYNEHHQTTATGIEDYLKQRGYNMFLSITNFHADEEQRCLQWLKQQRYDGLIIALATGNALYEEVTHLRKQGYVITGLGFDEPNIDYVRTEEMTGEQQVLKHLIKLGHRRIGYIYGVAHFEKFDRRLATCLELQQDLGVPVVERWIYRCGPRRTDGYQATQALLRDNCDDLPTAIIVVNDLLATAVLAALHAEQIAVPAAISVASFDNTPLTDYTFPPLTSVDCEGPLMGEHAARMTLERLVTPQRPLEQIMMRPKLIVRESTGPAPL